MKHNIKWIDAGREPACKPDPNYPEGKDIAALTPGPTCYVKLPYPAKRVGAYIIECETCGLRYAVTTAGRPDDPRSILMNCKPN